ncbi:hypothetical protein RRG08_033066 [Elysia crispata]|uniref:Uncharacterized protein n=1 Tax=Elysia crispata TaxID=231223 RepID=A0AAE1A7K2_9GAST|nr:hypothetical protein RRG08_033066 [Elysia crispata]
MSPKKETRCRLFLGAPSCPFPAWPALCYHPPVAANQAEERGHRSAGVCLQLRAKLTHSAGGRRLWRGKGQHAQGCSRQEKG